MRCQKPMKTINVSSHLSWHTVTLIGSIQCQNIFPVAFLMCMQKFASFPILFLRSLHSVASALNSGWPLWCQGAIFADRITHLFTAYSATDWLQMWLPSWRPSYFTNIPFRVSSSLAVVQVARFTWGYRTHKMPFNAPRRELRNKFFSDILNGICLWKVTS